MPNPSIQNLHDLLQPGAVLLPNHSTLYHPSWVSTYASTALIPHPPSLRHGSPAGCCEPAVGYTEIRALVLVGPCYTQCPHPLCSWLSRSSPRKTLRGYDNRPSYALPHSNESRFSKNDHTMVPRFRIPRQLRFEKLVHLATLPADSYLTRPLREDGLWVFFWG